MRSVFHLPFAFNCFVVAPSLVQIFAMCGRYIYSNLPFWPLFRGNNYIKKTESLEIVKKCAPSMAKSIFCQIKKEINFLSNKQPKNSLYVSNHWNVLMFHLMTRIMSVILISILLLRIILQIEWVFESFIFWLNDEQSWHSFKPPIFENLFSVKPLSVIFFPKIFPKVILFFILRNILEGIWNGTKFGTKKKIKIVARCGHLFSSVINEYVEDVKEIWKIITCTALESQWCCFW